MTVTYCPSWLVAMALTRLSTWYWLWERDINSRNPGLRRLALRAKATGIVSHDRILACASEVPHG